MQYQQSIQEFEQFLQASTPQIPSFHPYFATAFWEMLLCGGKRFRPNLLLAVVSGLNPLMTNNAFLPALALECLHTYSLIHDDLPCMDNAPLRRGKPTLHTTYDEVSATLVGDGLNTYAFYLLSCAKLDSSVCIQLVKELSYAGGIGGMIIGQALDCHFENQALPLEKLQEIHSNKTAKLIAASLKMGAIIANAADSLTQDLWDFGLRLGLFFQIRDDVIDAVQEENQAGKPTRNDGQKNSYVNLLGLTQAKQLLAVESTFLTSLMERFPTPIKHNLQWLLGDYFKEIV